MCSQPLLRIHVQSTTVANRMLYLFTAHVTWSVCVCVSSPKLRSLVTLQLLTARDNCKVVDYTMRLIVTYEWVLLYTWMKHLYGNMSVGIHMDEARHTSGVVTNVKGLLRFCFEKLFSCCFIRVNTACHTYGRDVSHMRIRHVTRIMSHGTHMWRVMCEYANSSCYETNLRHACSFALYSLF